MMPSESPTPGESPTPVEPIAAHTPSGLIVDANLLLRLAHPPDPAHAVAVEAITHLTNKDVPLYIAPQTMYEFWVVATRPQESRGGLGWTTVQADTEISRFESLFEILPETPAVYRQWRSLCANYGISGLAAHDARLVALLLVHRKAYDLEGILTFNTRHFRRFITAENITVLDPAMMNDEI